MLQHLRPVAHMTLRRSADRLVILLLALAVTALFSVVPFKVPRVNFAPHVAYAQALHSPAGASMGAAPVDFHDGLVHGTVAGKRNASKIWGGSPPAAGRFAGNRSVACRPPVRARCISPPIPYSFRLRAPPLRPRGGLVSVRRLPNG